MDLDVNQQVIERQIKDNLDNGEEHGIMNLWIQKWSYYFSKVYAFCEEEGHVIMDCPFMPFHIKTSIIKQKPKIHVVQNILEGMDLES